jgi:hypothetical protein
MWALFCYGRAITPHEPISPAAAAGCCPSTCSSNPDITLTPPKPSGACASAVLAPDRAWLRDTTAMMAALEHKHKLLHLHIKSAQATDMRHDVVCLP